MELSSLYADGKCSGRFLRVSRSWQKRLNSGQRLRPYPAILPSVLTLAMLLPPVLMLTSTQALAQTKTFIHRAPDGTVTFSDFPIQDADLGRQSYSSFTKQASIVNPCLEQSRKSLAERGNRLNARFVQASSQFGIDAALIKAVARAESCFDPQAVSSAGAKGLMQLMPATALELGVTNVFNLDENLRAGADYLARMLERYANDLDLALAAYNAGPGNVDKYGGVPPFSETQKYIRSVKAFKRQYSPLPAKNNLGLSGY